MANYNDFDTVDSSYVDRYLNLAQKDIANYSRNHPKGRLITNHDRQYDYYKTDDGRLLTRRKGSNNWIDISDNEVAVSRINNFISKKNNNSGKQNKNKVVKYTKPTSITSSTQTPTKTAAQIANGDVTSEEMRQRGFVQNEKGFYIPIKKEQKPTVKTSTTSKKPSTKSTTKPNTKVTRNSRFHYSEEIPTTLTNGERYRQGKIGLLDYLKNIVFK